MQGMLDVWGWDPLGRAATGGASRAVRRLEEGLLRCASLVQLQPPFPPAFPSPVPHLAWFILLSKQMNQLLLWLEWHERAV